MYIPADLGQERIIGRDINTKRNADIKMKLVLKMEICMYICIKMSTFIKIKNKTTLLTYEMMNIQTRTHNY